MFRISHIARRTAVDVDSIDEVEPAIASSKPGRYHINQISAEPLPSGHTSRRWGVGIKATDGSVVIERDTWDGESAFSIRPR